MAEISISRFFIEMFLVVWFGLCLLAALLAYTCEIVLIFLILLIVVVKFFRVEPKEC